MAYYLKNILLIRSIFKNVRTSFTMKKLLFSLITGFAVCSCYDAEDIHPNAPISAYINGNYWYANSVDAYYLNNYLTISASNSDKYIVLRIRYPHIGNNYLNKDKNSYVYYKEYANEQIYGNWYTYSSYDANVIISKLDTINASQGHVMGEFSAEVDYSSTKRIKITDGKFNVSLKQLYCELTREPAVIEDHNLVGDWELIEIEDVNNDTIYYPACYKNYTPSISFTDFETYEKDSLYDFYANIDLGVNDLIARYSIISIDSLNISCGEITLSLGLPYSVHFADIYAKEICSSMPLKFRFTVYYLLLTNSDNVVMKFIKLE